MSTPSQQVLVWSALSGLGLSIYATYKFWQLRKMMMKRNVYEENKTLDEYLMFHYGQPNEDLWNQMDIKKSLDFPRRCAELCLRYASDVQVPSRALDIGCAVGRSTFELTAGFKEVIGVDYSHSFINACKTLKKDGKLSYSVIIEGDLIQKHKATINNLLEPEKCTFQQGDACDLPSDLGQFSCILAANLICRLHDPGVFLDRLPSLLVSGGILVITSPYTFLEEFTAKDKWIGSYYKNGAEYMAFEGLKERLGIHFDLVAQENMPFLIRETARKNQWTVAHATVWKRK